MSLGGFYSEVVRRIGARRLSPSAMLLVVVTAAGLLSAVLVNDIVCFAMAPVLVVACAGRGFNPVPFLLGLAAASNVGSAMTLIGNPQNMLIGQTLRLSFSWYLREALVPSLAGLGVTWLVIRVLWRGRWEAERVEVVAVDGPPFNRWQASKGVVVLAGTVGLFLFSPWPREVIALAAAGVLLLSRRMASYEMLGLVDWHLLVLFAGLFVVHDATARAGLLDAGFASLRGSGVDLARPGWIFAVTPVLSNLVSNVPAVMLLLPVTRGPLDGLALALSSTLAGNFLIVGSIANIIVIDQAARCGIQNTMATHVIAGVWVAIRG